MIDLSSGPASRHEVLILDNPLAGTHDHHRQVQDLIHALHVLGLETVVCCSLAELSDMARKHAKRFRCVVAAGGDGTLNEVLNRAPGLPVAVLPVGNENLVARFFRVGRSAAFLADAIAAVAVERLDLGRVDGRLFSLMASMGIDAQVVHDVHRARHGHIGKWNYVGPVMRALRSYPFPTVEVVIEDTGERLRGAMAFFFNLPMYALGLPMARRARADDGCLDLLVFERPGVVNLARYVGALVARRHEKLPDVQVRRVKRAHLYAAQPVPLQIDGDPAGKLPATIEVVPATFQLIVPRR